MELSKTKNVANFNELIDSNNKIITEIFQLVKERNWDQLTKLIRSVEIDLNIKDGSGMWLLEYAILFNQMDLIDILIEKNVRLDITDDNSKSILYNVIKFSYKDVLIKFLEKDKTVIGKSILELKDINGNIPLFYSINLFNIECTKIILKYTTNFYISNYEGENALHLSIKTQNLEFFKLIWEYFPDTKSRNKIGESYLHLMVKLKCYDMLEYFILSISDNLNIKEILNYSEFKYNFTILHYISIGFDYESLEILNKTKIIHLLDGNLQDNSGNIFYHYFISNILNFKNIPNEILANILKINKLFEKIKWNINIYNIDGNTPAHLFFSSINFLSSINLNLLINNLIENIDMNIQNFIGESVLYLVVKNNYWKNISNILTVKKLDIFVIVENDKTIFDYLEKKDFDEFLDMIVQSYLNQLKNSKKSSKWIEYWDNRCKKIVKLSELNETELEIVNNLNIINDFNNSKTKSDLNVCFEVIKNKLSKAIEIFIKSKNSFEQYSYPVDHKFTKLILSYPSVIVSTFSGSTIDVLSGIIYLLRKFNSKDNSNNIVSTLNLLKNSNQVIICKNYFSQNDNSNNHVCEINGFEILWINKNIIFPTHLNQTINTIIRWIFNNKENGYRWFIVPIGIEFKNFSHANYLLIDVVELEIERFEPHGAHSPIGMNYDAELLDTLIFNYIEESGLSFTYFKPKDYLPKIGFQTIEINELKSDYIGDPNGFCALWCIWWIDMRLSNQNTSRNKLVKLLNKELINNKYSYKKLIRDYSFYTVEIRDNFFMRANTNINEWLNDIIPEKNIHILDSILKNEINNL